MLHNNRKTKKQQNNRTIKCDICKKRMNEDAERRLGNIIMQNGVSILYCECGNEIVLK